MSKVIKLVNAPNYLERELGQLSAIQKEEVRSVLADFMTEVRAILRANGSAFYEIYSEEERPCATCALNPMTDDFPGFLPTAYGLMRACRDRKLFVCHDNQEDWEKNLIDMKRLKLCGGFVSLAVTDPKGVHTAANRAMKKIRTIVPM